MGDFCISRYGTIDYKVEGVFHRLDGPARTWADGSEEWWVNDQLHRLDGPAILRTNGAEEWWINGKEMSATVKQFFVECSINPNWKEWTDEEKVLFRLRF